MSIPLFLADFLPFQHSLVSEERKLAGLAIPSWYLNPAIFPNVRLKFESETAGRLPIICLKSVVLVMLVIAYNGNPENAHPDFFGRNFTL